MQKSNFHFQSDLPKAIEAQFNGKEVGLGYEMSQVNPTMAFVHKKINLPR